ncbi:hypothetical protein [Roseibium suaedae]|uniref:DUF2125 domain-containing protein n=1 Tax=Roseibium suaedae TaxID=735517 RepID=A0A1M7LA80_9HYPH|nr:hypothetical protein [Roseibium suaedae]SHM75005.1 hypothetical protein SAMN05444272_3138 [Roseibium suaedae]
MANPVWSGTAEPRFSPMIRHGLPATALALWCSLTPAAHAQDSDKPASGNDATAILQTWTQGLNALDGVTASFKAVKAGDLNRSASLQGGKISFNFSEVPWIAENGGTTMSRLSVTISFDEIDFGGLRESGGLIEADTIAIPGSLDFSMKVEPEPDAPKKISADGKEAPEAGGKPEADTGSPVVDDVPALNTEVRVLIPSTMDASYQDVLIEDFSIPAILPDKPEADSDTIATARQWLAAFRQVRVARAFVSEATSNSTGDSTGPASSVYNDMLMLDLKDGRIAEQAVSSFRVIQEATGENGETHRVDFNGGAATVRGLDIAPFAMLLGGPDEPGRTTLLDREELLDLTFSSEGTKGSIDSIMLEDLSLLDTSKANLVEIASRAEKGEELSEDDIGTAVLLDLGRFSLGRMEMNGLSADGEEGNAQLRRFLLKGLSGSGLAELSIDGLQVQAKDGTTEAPETNGGDAEATSSATGVFLDHAGLFRVGFPSAAALAVLGQVDEPTPSQIRDALPTVGKMILSALEVTVPDGTADGDTGSSGEDAAAKSTIRLNLAELLQGGFTDKIPTRSSFVIDGLSIPASQITDPGLSKILDDLGIEELEFNQSFAASWNPVTEDLSLSNLTVELRGGGKASLSLELGKIPAMIFTSPELAQVALAGAVIKSGRLRITGEELVSALLSDQAQETQLTEEQLADGFAEALRGEIGPLAGTNFGDDLIKGFRSFLTDPDELSVVLAPKTPVGVAELLALAVTAPSAIPDRLEAKVISGASK